MTWQRAMYMLLEEMSRAELGEMLGCTDRSVDMWADYTHGRSYANSPDGDRRNILAHMGIEYIKNPRAIRKTLKAMRKAKKKAEAAERKASL